MIELAPFVAGYRGRRHEPDPVHPIVLHICSPSAGTTLGRPVAKVSVRCSALKGLPADNHLTQTLNRQEGKIVQGSDRP